MARRAPTTRYEDLDEDGARELFAERVTDRFAPDGVDADGRHAGDFPGGSGWDPAKTEYNVPPIGMLALAGPPPVNPAPTGQWPLADVVRGGFWILHIARSREILYETERFHRIESLWEQLGETYRDLALGAPPGAWDDPDFASALCGLDAAVQGLARFRAGGRRKASEVEPHGGLAIPGMSPQAMGQFRPRNLAAAWLAAAGVDNLDVALLLRAWGEAGSFESVRDAVRHALDPPKGDGPTRLDTARQLLGWLHLHGLPSPAAFLTRVVPKVEDDAPLLMIVEKARAILGAGPGLPELMRAAAADLERSATAGSGSTTDIPDAIAPALEIAASAAEFATGRPLQLHDLAPAPSDDAAHPGNAETTGWAVIRRLQQHLFATQAPDPTGPALLHTIRAHWGDHVALRTALGLLLPLPDAPTQPTQ